MHIRQGYRSADEYKLEFERYQADAKFDKVTLTMYFKEGLQNWLYDRICDIENPPDDENLEKWKKKACDFDRNNRRKREFKQGMTSYRTPSSFHSEPNFRLVLCHVLHPSTLPQQDHLLLLNIILQQHLHPSDLHQYLWTLREHDKEALPILPKSNALSVIKKDTMTRD